MQPENPPQETVQQPIQTSTDSGLAPAPQTTVSLHASSNSHKKLYIIGGIIIALMLGAIAALVIVLLNGSDDKATQSNVTTTQSATSTNSQATTKPSNTAKQVLLISKTSNEKLELQIYQPTQNASNTTINFGVKNTCSGCSDTTFTGNVVSGYSNNVTSYLVDDAQGKKYSVISDEDGKVLASSSCGSYIKYNDTTDCFVAFSKVPSGSTVSWVFGSSRIDGIKIE